MHSTGFVGSSCAFVYTAGTRAYQQRWARFMYLIFWPSDSCCISLSSTVLNKLISEYLMIFYGFVYAPVQKKIYPENPPGRIPGSEPGTWELGAENGVLRRLLAPRSAIGNLVSPVPGFGAWQKLVSKHNLGIPADDITYLLMAID